MDDSTLVVTRHPALIEYLREQGKITGEVRVMAQVSPDDVKGKHVIGILPLNLAALASTVTTVDLNVPAEKRGVQLSLEEVRAFAGNISTYKVEKVS